jgi:adenosylhomocysteinase
VDALNEAKGVTSTNIKPQVDMYRFQHDGHSIFMVAEGALGEPRLRDRPSQLRDEQ